MAGSLSDITDRRSRSALQHDALHDALTGLPNRALFLDRVDQVLQRSARDPTAGCAVLFLDIDRFKLVNDSLSHAVGDQLLVALAGRLPARCGPATRSRGSAATSSRSCSRTSPAPRTRTVVAERVLQPLDDAVPARRPRAVRHRQRRHRAQLARPGRRRAGAQRRHRDVRRQAPRPGSRSAVFDESMHRRVVDRLARENELRQVVEARCSSVHYQPIVDLATGRISGLEALARWPADWPPVSPLEFIPIAEETG